LLLGIVSIKEDGPVDRVCKFVCSGGEIEDDSANLAYETLAKKIVVVLEASIIITNEKVITSMTGMFLELTMLLLY
jgi:hypothetical protein